MDHVNVDEKIKVVATTATTVVVVVVIGVVVGVVAEEFRHFAFDNTIFVQGQWDPVRDWYDGEQRGYFLEVGPHGCVARGIGVGGVPEKWWSWGGGGGGSIRWWWW